MKVRENIRDIQGSPKNLPETRNKKRSGKTKFFSILISYFLDIWPSCWVTSFPSIGDSGFTRYSKELVLPFDWACRLGFELRQLENSEALACAAREVGGLYHRLQARLGAESLVSMLHDVALVLITDEVLGGWSMLKLWKHERLTCKGEAVLSLM